MPAAKPPGDDARSHDERLQRRERTGDGIGEAEREKVRFGIRSEDAKWQDDETCGGAGGNRLRIREEQRRAELLCEGVGGLVAIVALFGERLVDDAIER